MSFFGGNKQPMTEEQSLVIAKFGIMPKDYTKYDGIIREVLTDKLAIFLSEAGIDTITQVSVLKTFAQRVAASCTVLTAYTLIDDKGLKAVLDNYKKLKNKAKGGIIREVFWNKFKAENILKTIESETMAKKVQIQGAQAAFGGNGGGQRPSNSANTAVASGGGATKAKKEDDAAGGMPIFFKVVFGIIFAAIVIAAWSVSNMPTITP